jgi:glycerophosphoryl diester phosphodiesterase
VEPFQLPFAGGERSSVIAHRGGAALGVANSVAVMELAAASGADVVEIDVQELGDGELVLFHDSTVTHEGHAIRLHDIGRDRFEELIDGPATPFTSLAERLPPLGLGLYLDVKRVTADGLIRIIDSLVASPLRARSVIGSFSAGVVRGVVADGRLPASLLYHDRSADPLSLAAELDVRIVHPCFDSDPWMVGRMAGAWMERVHAGGLCVVGWNSNDAVVLGEMIAAGFDAICTDDPRLVPRR